MKAVITSFSVEERANAAAEFLGRFANQEVLIVAPTRMAADELVRAICLRTGSVFGVHRYTPVQLAIEAATKRLVNENKTILAGVAVDALAARAVYECRKRGNLEWFDSVARTSGFFRALASTISELRLSAVPTDQLEQSGASGKDLANLLTEYRRNLDETGLADAALIYETAIVVVNNDEFPPGKFPILFFDFAPTSFLEQEFIRALASRSSEVTATVHARDVETIRLFSDILGTESSPPQLSAKREPDKAKPQERGEPRPFGRGWGGVGQENQPVDQHHPGASRHPSSAEEGSGASSALQRLRQHVFQIEAPPIAEGDQTVQFLSATDENRECVEIARAVLTAAKSGMLFDRMAVLLRNPELYQPLLEDAFRRAGIRAHFTQGTQRPNVGGRALLALLACASEKLSASRFSEYLSLGQLPPERQPEPVWVPPQGELFAHITPSETAQESEDSSEPPVRAPRYWERLLVDAAVIGGYDRWFRRLEGLQKELRKRAGELGVENEPARNRIEHDISRLKSLQEFALPVVRFLDQLPPAATWNEWLDRLEELARIALRQPEVVLSVLVELRPMGGIGPVTLDEVRESLTERLTFLRSEPADRRYGKVFVSTITEASGVAFDIVFLPGLGEDIFPKKSFEDPLLLDGARISVSSHLSTQDTRVQRERMLLHLAASAVRSRLWISYPRMDLGQGRRRGPSFYALDVIRAINGKIPDLNTLQQRAVETSQSQIGWPAPRDPAVAIDDAEYDLAAISGVLRKPPSEVKGAGQYLMETSAPLGRSLRARWARWHGAWSASDGIVLQPADAALSILRKHRLAERQYSATALQQFAICPYRFALHSIYSLHPREDIAALERMDPLTRGSLFHEVQFRLLSRLKEQNLLPFSTSNQTTVVQIADEVLDEVQGIYREDLDPAIPRVWESEVEEIRWDLRGWIRQVVTAPDSSQWIPGWFELPFSVRLPEGNQLRGAVDMIEEKSGRLRITDHKTGKVPSEPIRFVGRGEVLQPLLYALAAEAVLGKPAEQSRLFYCTETGGYRTIDVPINDQSRNVIRQVFGLIDQSIAAGFIPAAPRENACQYCDYHTVCGPYEQIRIRRKAAGNLAAIQSLREIQ
jgi:RecB family exonuclease